MMQTITSGSCLPGKSLDMGSSDIQKSWVFQGVLFSLLMNKYGIPLSSLGQDLLRKRRVLCNL